jgi:hypothetical protein
VYVWGRGHWPGGDDGNANLQSALAASDSGLLVFTKPGEPAI